MARGTGTFSFHTTEISALLNPFMAKDVTFQKLLFPKLFSQSIQIGRKTTEAKNINKAVDRNLPEEDI